MWYIKINGKHWLHIKGEMMCGNNSPIFAQAFGPLEVEQHRQALIGHGHTVELVECSTRKIIPENMLKVLNLA